MDSRRSRGRWIGLSVLCAVAAAPGAMGQVLLYEDSFGSGTDGWSSQEYDAFCPIGGFVRDVTDLSVVASGGMTGQFLRVVEPAIGGSAYLRAPQSLVQNLINAHGGWLTFERRVERVTGTFFTGLQDEVTIVTSGGERLVAIARVLGPGAWRSRSVPLVHTAWRIGSCSGPIATRSQFEAALQSAADVFLTSEAVNGIEINDLDSVRLWSAPPSSCGEGWRWVDNAEPTARWGHAVALDTARNVIVLYGGLGGETDTWEYTPRPDGTGTWRRTATQGPGPKANAAMVYDASRGCTVLMGGFYAPIAGFPEYLTSNQVWEYRSDGVTGVWTRSSGSLPQPRESLQAVYDVSRSTIVAYGGLSSGNGSTDVLERGPGSDQWTVVTPQTSPGPQRGHAMAFDSVRNATYLVAGGSGTVQVWVWSPSATPPAWTLVNAANPPGSRFRMGLAFDPRPNRAVLVMAGGENGDTDFNGTFEFNVSAAGGPAWAQRGSIRLVPGGDVQLRTRHAMSWNPIGNQVLLFGGMAGEVSPQRQVLSFDGATNIWQARWNTFAIPPRDFAGVAYDEAEGRVIVAGGGLITRPGASPARQLGGGAFAWNGTSWSGLPGLAAGQEFWKAPMVYVPTTNPPCMLVYGGEVGGVGNSRVSAQVYKLSLGANPAWSVVTASAPPGRRANMAASFDRLLGKVVFFGGRDETGAFRNDTWLYDPLADQWTAVQPPISPPARNGPRMVFDERRGVTVMFGGRLASGEFDASTWEFNGTTWRNVTPTDGGPTPRGAGGLVFVPDRGTVVLAGGEVTDAVNSTGENDLWEYDGVAWRQLFPTETEAVVGRIYSSIAYDRVNRRLVRFGGSSIAFAQAGTDYAWFISGQTWTLEIPRVPVLTRQPSSTFICPGSAAQLVVESSRPETDQYRWRRDGIEIDPNTNPSAVTPVLMLAHSDPSAAGLYDCLVRSDCGTTISATALVTVLGCCSPADFNADGFIDFFDYNDFVDCFELGVCPQGASADFDGDGFTDFFDFAAFVEEFEQGC